MIDKLMKNGFEVADIKGEYFSVKYNAKSHKIKATLMLGNDDYEDSFVKSNCIKCNVLDVENMVIYQTCADDKLSIETYCLIHVFEDAIIQAYNSSEFLQTIYDNWEEIAIELMENDMRSITSTNGNGDSVGIVLYAHVSRIKNIEIDF